MGGATFLLEALENSLLHVVPAAWEVDPTCGPLSNSAEGSYERDLTCSYKLTTRWEFYCCCSNCMVFKCDLFRWQHGVTCQKAGLCAKAAHVFSTYLHSVFTASSSTTVTSASHQYITSHSVSHFCFPPPNPSLFLCRVHLLITPQSHSV